MADRASEWVWDRHTIHHALHLQHLSSLIVRFQGLYSPPYHRHSPPVDSPGPSDAAQLVARNVPPSEDTDGGGGGSSKVPITVWWPGIDVYIRRTNSPRSSGGCVCPDPVSFKAFAPPLPLLVVVRWNVNGHESLDVRH